jgi:hypothetical protein
LGPLNPSSSPIWINISAGNHRSSDVILVQERRDHTSAEHRTSGIVPIGLDLGYGNWHQRFRPGAQSGGRFRLVLADDVGSGQWQPAQGHQDPDQAGGKPDADHEGREDLQQRLALTE